VKNGRVIAAAILLLASFVMASSFYELYLYNVYITNLYLHEKSGVTHRIAIVVVIIPLRASVDPRVGFEPAMINVVIGVNNTVTWKNEDTTWHTAHSNVPEFYSNLIAPGGNYTHTFQSPGIFPYHCDPHPWMTGRIIVRQVPETQVAEQGTLGLLPQQQVLESTHTMATRMPTGVGRAWMI